MPPATPANTAATPRQKMFWALIGALALGQLIAFWMLCNHQVRQAQMRGAAVQVERTAAPRRHDPDAVLAATQNTANLSATAAGRATHVNFSLH